MWRRLSCSVWLLGVLAAPGTQESVARAAGNSALEECGNNTGQHAPVFSPGEHPSLTEKSGRRQSTGSQRVGHYRSDPVRIDADFFVACGSSAPVRVEHEGGAAAWIAYPGGIMCAETWTASTAGVTALSVFFRASCSRRSEGLFGHSFSAAPSVRAPKGLPCLGAFSVVWCQAHRWDLWLGS